MRKEPGKDKFSFERRIKSFGYAFKGLRSFFLTTHNAWIHTFIAFVVIIAGLFFKVTTTEWIAIVLSIGIVFTAEAFNTAMEKYVDLVKPEFDVRAGTIKDIAAGAVLLSAVCAATVGLLIFMPRIIELFNP